MRYLVLLALLLPVSANAASFTKDDCALLAASTESCLTSEAGAIASGAMAHAYSDFDKRHPTFEPWCPRVITAYRTYCNTRAAPITNGCEGRSSRCSELPDGNLEFKCYHGGFVVSKKTGTIVKDNCNKEDN
ncbi:hypothetical protein ACVWXO_001273 [Bradyrhizobium sp. LM2.7]